MIALHILLASVAAAAFGASETDADRIMTPRQLIQLPREQLATNPVKTLRGIVTFASAIESNRFVIADEEHQTWMGVAVRAGRGCATPSPGSLVRVKGRVAAAGDMRIVDATEIDVMRVETLNAAQIAKQSDFRRGILEGRLVTLLGTVHDVDAETNETGVVVSMVKLYMDKYTAILRVAGRVEPEGLLGMPIRATGLAVTRFSESGDFLDTMLEVSGSEGIEVIEGDTVPRAVVVSAVVFAGVLLVASLVMLFLWLRELRERREMSVVAAERRRMAADLHDTIEQHLAGANLIAAGVSQLEDAPPDVKEAMRTLAALLANAKAEVRSAVLNLRSAGDDDRNLGEMIADIADGLAKTGVKTRKCLRGLPTSLPRGVLHDIVLIVREATTNAVKHGKAKAVVFTADPLGERGFRIRVLNDGVSFEVDRALGPETGHYGLSGMKERALRNRLAISWGTEGRWTCVQLDSEGVYG